MGLRDKLDLIIETVFPSNIYCAVCGSLIDRSRPYALCDKCVREMHWITGKTCSVCGKALPDTYRGRGTDGRPVCYDCKERSHFFTRGWSCLSYGLHEREIMMDIKYNGKGYLARKMGDVMYDRMEVLIDEARQGGVKPFDVVIPVPVGRKRLVKRGYNQSELMARQLVRRWADADRKADRDRVVGGGQGAGVAATCPRLEKHVLVRGRDTVMLRSLNPEERRLALRDAFAVEQRLRRRIEGRSVLLIDDIYTTGATADACSKTLLEAGASEVYLLTLASGGNRKPKEEQRDDGTD
ncbi:MAG: ComF family protein [Bacillota bacterium]